MNISLNRNHAFKNESIAESGNTSDGRFHKSVSMQNPSVREAQSVSPGKGGMQNATFDNSELFIESGSAEYKDDSTHVVRSSFQRRQSCDMVGKGPRRRTSFRRASCSIQNFTGSIPAGSIGSKHGVEDLHRALRHAQAEEGQAPGLEPITPDLSPSSSLKGNSSSRKSRPSFTKKNSQMFSTSRSSSSRSGSFSRSPGSGRSVRMEDILCNSCFKRATPYAKILSYIFYALTFMFLSISYVRTVSIGDDLRNMTRHQENVANNVASLNSNLENSQDIVKNLRSELTSLKDSNQDLVIKTSALEMESKYYAMKQREGRLEEEKAHVATELHKYKERDVLLVERVNTLVEKIQAESYREVHER